MKRRGPCATAVAAALGCTLFWTAAVVPSADAQTTPKSLVIALDGARADALEIVSMPAVSSLIDGTWQPGYRGAYSPFAQTIKDASTVSGPNHTAILTGVTAAKHGVTGNDSGQMAAVVYPDYLELLERDDPARETVKLVYWSLDMLLPTGADYELDDSDAANASRAAAMMAGTYGDAEWTPGRDVDAMFLFLDDADGFGHSEGWLSEEYFEELASIDSQIQGVLDAIAARPSFPAEDWQIVITSDHGGYNFSHGSDEGAHYNIPFLVASKDVLQGELDGRPSDADVTATVLEHFGIDSTGSFLQIDMLTPYTLDGTARGDSIRTPHAGSLGDGLVSYHRFEFDHVDATGRGNDIVVAAGKPRFSRGLFGRAAKVNKKNFLSLGTGQARPDFEFGGPAAAATDFSMVLWYRGRARKGDPVILGNKDWASGANQGFILTANVSNRSEIGLNLADQNAAREDVYRIDMSRKRKWQMIALTVDRATERAVLYAGGGDGVLFYISNDIDTLDDLGSLLPINIGQDGTGTYGDVLRARIDDLGIWRRALDKGEIESIYNGGAGVELAGLAGLPPSGF